MRLWSDVSPVPRFKGHAVLLPHKNSSNKIRIRSLQALKRYLRFMTEQIGSGNRNWLPLYGVYLVQADNCNNWSAEEQQ